MQHRMIGPSLAGAALLALSGSAGAVDEIVTARGWTQVDHAESGECRAEVRGNGQFYRIAVQGLRPGEVGQFWLQNEDIRPVQYRMVADGSGAWRDFYVPFVWQLEGGIVRVALTSETCSLNLSFAWARRRL
ncbi:MAG TPA: hypothetical protein VI168_08695 [Croceibacterium sp.]